MRDSSEPQTTFAYVDEDYRLATLLYQTVDTMLRVRSIENSRQGRTNAETTALLAIYNLGDGALSTRIADWIFRRRNTAFSLLSRMERDGLVIRKQDMKQPNLVRYELTDYGLDMLKATSDRQSVHDVLGALPSQEKEQMAKMLYKVRQQGLGLLQQQARHDPHQLKELNISQHLTPGQYHQR